ncbi:hypothetical protein BJX64DRAFT_287593 [Aspergillus heterothallicus]
MARTPNNRSKWFLSKRPPQRLEAVTPPSTNTKATTKTKSNEPPSSSSAKATTASPSAAADACCSSSSSSPSTIPRDLYASLEKYYKPLYAIICQHEFIQGAQYPVRQSARIRFVRDVFEEGGLMGYSDEVIRQVLVDVKRYFLERAGMLDVFEEAGGKFGEEVDDMDGFDVVVGDRYEDSEGLGSESRSEQASVVSGVDGRVEGASEDEEPFLERLVEAALGSSHSLENGVVYSSRAASPIGDQGEHQTQPEKPEKKKKRRRKHKRSRDQESVELHHESDEPLGVRNPSSEAMSSDQTMSPTGDQDQYQTKPEEPEKKRRRRKRDRGEAFKEIPRELGETLNNHEETIADITEDQVDPVKHEKRRKKKKRTHGKETMDVSYETNELLDDHEVLSADPIESQIKPAKLEKKRKRKLRHVEESVELCRKDDGPLGGNQEKSLEPVEKPEENLKPSRSEESIDMSYETAELLNDHKLESATPADPDPEEIEAVSDGKSGTTRRRERRKKDRKRKHKRRGPRRYSHGGFLRTNDSRRLATGDEVRSKYFVNLRPTKSRTPIRAEVSKTRNLHSSIPDDVRAMIEDAGLDFDPFLSDSTLSDVPSDLDSVPDSPPPCARSLYKPVIAISSVDELPEIPTEPLCVRSPRYSTPQEEQPPTQPGSPSKPALAVDRKKPRPKLSKISPYFPSPIVHAESCLPFPPIDAPAFGLVQEQLAHDPFRLLLATIFLNRTRGGVALPVLFRVFDQYPTIEAMAAADPAHLTSMINCLGFQNQRAKKCITLAQTWLDSPPCGGKRYRKLNYPRKLDGRDVKPTESIDDNDSRVAWEIAHLPGVGAYALDSWRIFCRDELRGLATDWQGNGATKREYTPEWKSVLPQDKELRAYLTWMWLKEGWVWDRETGETTRASEKVMRAARRGGTAHLEEGNWTLGTSPVKNIAR